MEESNHKMTPDAITLPQLNKPKPPENFEEILDQLGGFGFFQFITLILLLILEIPAAFISFIPVFVGAHRGTWYCGDDRQAEYSSKEICGCNNTITAVSNSNSEESIVAQWNLVCDSAWVSDFITSIQMFAMVLGCLVFCKLCDWYGRRYTLLSASIIMAVGQGLSAVAFDPYSYAATRFIGGMGMAGYLSLVYAYIIEFQPVKWRSLSCSAGPWGEGVMLLALAAYYIRPWRILTGITTLPFLIIFVMFLVVPESPRWLIRNQKVAEAHKVLGYMAKVNGKPNIELEVLQEVVNKESPPDDDKALKRYGYLDLFRDESLRYVTIYQMILMGANGAVYYGLNFNVKNMVGSPYLITMLLGLSDSFGYPSALFICNRIGRTVSLAVFMSVEAVVLGILAILELSVGLGSVPTWAIILCLMVKFCAAAGRSCARTILGELYPTAVRGMGAGLACAGASLGAILSPQLAYAGSSYPAIPYFMFAFFAILAALVSLRLTETVGKPLMTQVNELCEESASPTLQDCSTVNNSTQALYA